MAAYMPAHGADGAPGAPLTSVATLECMRVNEVARLQVWLFDYLASFRKRDPDLRGRAWRTSTVG